MWLDHETHWEIPCRVYTNWDYAKKVEARLNRMSRGKKDTDGFIYSYNVNYSELDDSELKS
jgi:hypothetical protein